MVGAFSPAAAVNSEKQRISLHGKSNAPQGDFREYHGSVQVFKNGAGYKMKQVNQMLQSITEARHAVRQS
jgi:hypothetical protein